MSFEINFYIYPIFLLPITYLQYVYYCIMNFDYIYLKNNYKLVFAEFIQFILACIIVLFAIYRDIHKYIINNIEYLLDVTSNYVDNYIIYHEQLKQNKNE